MRLDAAAARNTVGDLGHQLGLSVEAADSSEYEQASPDYTLDDPTLAPWLEWMERSNFLSLWE